MKFNVKDFHVGLHITFADKADHDRYQGFERNHKTFVEKIRLTGHRQKFLTPYVLPYA
ncbi:MAG: hypothetical protein U5N58_13195 [Actinomycetota bacterium]|nr:hypothetical protein [Actinomycetota bacterium]